MIVAAIVVAACLGVLVYVAWGMGYGRDSDDEHTEFEEPTK